MSIEKFPVDKLPGISRIRDIAARYYEKQLLADVLQSKNAPRHVAIILDGNRRFAENMGLDRLEGHLFDARKLEEVIGRCQELGIKHITVYAFSTENFDRSEKEVKH